jgi:hypothetical protein
LCKTGRAGAKLEERAFKYEGNEYYASYYKTGGKTIFRGYYTKKGISIFGIDFKIESEFETAYGAIPIGDRPQQATLGLTIALSGGILLKEIAYTSKVVEIFSGVEIVGLSAAWGIVYSMPLFLVSDTRIAGPYEGEIVDVIPLPLSSQDYIEPIAMPIPVSVPHAISDDGGNCKVYVIFVERNGRIDITKFGQTCRSDCDARPDSQCRRWNRDASDGGHYTWTWITPSGVSKDMANKLEKSLTASYVLGYFVANGTARLPEKHKLPCFVKGESEVFDKRTDLAEKWIQDMIDLFGN